jgi:hypothetical protein
MQIGCRGDPAAFFIARKFNFAKALKRRASLLHGSKTRVQESMYRMIGDGRLPLRVPCGTANREVEILRMHEHT